MSEDGISRTSEFKAFQFGPDTEPVFVPGEDADVGDAINIFNGMQEARRTAELPQNADFVDALEESLQEGRGELEKVVALQILSALVGELEDRFGELVEKEKVEDEIARKSQVLKLEEGSAVENPRFLEKLGGWKDDPPEFTKEVAADFLEDADWRETAEWAATHVMYWAARDVNKEYWKDGQDPEDVPQEEWGRRFNDQLTTEGYFQEVVEIIGGEWGRIVTEAVTEAKEEELSLLEIEKLLGLHDDDDDAPVPRPETPEFNPSPFQGDGETAGMLSGPFSSAVARSLVETPDEAASQPGHYEKEWGADSTGHPIRVEELHGQYSGRVTLRVQAYGEPDPTAVDAEMGWAMLQEMEMEEVWLHAFLLAHASAPGRRGEREVIRIPRTQIERLPMGFRSRNRSKWERAEKIKEHIDRLRSVFVQFQNVERHGDKLRFRHDMNATPLWSLRMVAEGEKDLFTGEEWSEWYLEAREGMWAEEFLHNHGEQWAPLPKEWFEQIDRRGSDWGQRLAVLLLFLFRTNRKQGGRVKLSAEKMLQACGVDLSVERDSSDRYDLKQKLSSALEDLHHNYGMRVQDGDVNMSKIDGRSYWTNWKNQTVTIDPPEKIDRRLLSGEGPERAPLPDTRPGRWSKKQIERLLNELGWTQKRLASELPVGKQSVSHYLNNRRAPSDNVRAALDRIQARHL
jgi:transcriptional regulator with XRE-family HTH domain